MESWEPSGLTEPGGTPRPGRQPPRPSSRQPLRRVKKPRHEGVGSVGDTTHGRADGGPQFRPKGAWSRGRASLGLVRRAYSQGRRQTCAAWRACSRLPGTEPRDQGTERWGTPDAGLTASPASGALLSAPEAALEPTPRTHLRERRRPGSRVRRLCRAPAPASAKLPTCPASAHVRPAVSAHPSWAQGWLVQIKLL